MDCGTPRSGGVLSAVLFAGMLVFVLMLIAGSVALKTVHVHATERDAGAGGADVSIDTPAGRLNIRARDRMNPALAGIPIYPGATREDSGGASIDWNSSRNNSDKSLYVLGGGFRTTDPARKVVDYYRSQLPNLLIVAENDRGTRLEYRDGGIRRIIVIHESGGETRIGLASIGSRESN